METSTIIATISVVIASLSAFFAATANKSAQKAAIANLLFELNKYYQELSASFAIRITWEEYKKVLKIDHGEKADIERLSKAGTEIKMESANLYNKKTIDVERDEKIDIAVNKTFWYWHLLAKLVDNKLISPETALTSFGDPEILGFLYPLDRDWIRNHSSSKLHKHYLQNLYETWIKLKKK